MPINSVYGSFEHFALCATLFERFAAGRISWIAGNHRHGRAMQATWVKAAVADRKSYTLDRRATAICRRCHRDTCRASLGWRTGQSTVKDSTRLWLHFSLTLLFVVTIFYIFPSAILSPFASTILSLCYFLLFFFALLLVIYSERGGVIIVTHETSPNHNRSHPPTSRNIAPAAKNDSHDSSSHEYCAQSKGSNTQTSPNIAPATKMAPNT